MSSEISVLIPIYNLLQDMGLLNTYAGLILPQTALGLSFGIFLITTFFKDIPRELIDAAVCDGCKDLQLLRHVMIPLGMPAIKALALIEFLWAWNSFFFPLVIATQQDLMPLSVAIIDFMGGSRSTTSWWLPPASSCSFRSSCSICSPRPASAEGSPSAH